MSHERTAMLASAIVILTGVLWGFYWLPVRNLTQMGLPGPWGTAAITGMATLILLPAALFQAGQLRRSSPLALLSIAIGGAAFALYSIGFVYGRVAIIILLYFLTPVWSTLIGRYVMGWETRPLRILAILIGLAGLATMLGADGTWPIPRGPGEWMALLAGLLWSIGTTGIRAKSDLDPLAATFVFALGALAASLLIAPIMEPLPRDLTKGALAAPLLITFATAALWWGLSIASLMWATQRLEPARVGILLMTEVLVGAGSAALLANEHLTGLEMLGGGLVLCAAILEILPDRRRSG